MIARQVNCFFRKNKTHLKTVLLPVIFTAILYLPSLPNDFVWDDFFVVADNPFIKNWQNLPRLFSKSYLTHPNDMPYVDVKDAGSGEGTYRPVVTLSYFLDYAIFKRSSFGFHLSNLFLHLLNVVLVYVLAFLLTRLRPIAFWTSFIFGILPAHAEAVLGIACREELLNFFFYVLAFILFLRADDRLQAQKRHCYYCCSAASFFLALFSKEMGATFLIMIFVAMVFFTFPFRIKRCLLRLKGRYLLYPVILLFYLFIRFFVLVIPAEPRGYLLGGTFYTNFLSMMRVFVKYLQWFVWPTDIRIVLPEEVSFVSYTIFDLRVLLAIGIVAIFLYSIFFFLKRKTVVSFACVWIVVTLLPVMNIVPIQNYIASRYLYLPAFGFCLLVGILFHQLFELRFRNWPRYPFRNLAQFFMIALVIYYSHFTFSRFKVWRNSLNFMIEIGEYYPNIPRVRVALGDAYMERGFTEKAIEEIQVALKLDPNYAKGYLTLGQYYQKRGDIEQAAQNYNNAIRLHPGLWYAYFMLGNISFSENQYLEAARNYNETIKRAPYFLPAFHNLAVSYASLGAPESAQEILKIIDDLDRQGFFANTARWQLLMQQ